jgi:hypothetical protein
MSEDILSRGNGLAAITVIAKMFYVLNEKGVLTAPERACPENCV